MIMFKLALPCLAVVLAAFPRFILSADEAWNIRFLLQQPFDSDTAQKITSSVPKLLYGAIISNNLDLVELILDYPQKNEAFKTELERTEGGFANMNYNQKRLLYTAISQGNMEIIRSLLDHGSNPNFMHEGKAIFEWAWNIGPKIVELLILSPELDLKFVGSSKQTILEHTADGRSSELVRLLLTSKEVDKFSEQELNHVLARSCFHGWRDIVKLLLDKKFKLDVNCLTKHGGTVIHLAASFGKWDIVKEIILARGDEIKDLNALNEYGKNILHYACVEGDLEAVVFLLDEKFNLDINRLTRYGQTAIQLAVTRKRWNIVSKIIVTRGEEIDLNALDRYGKNSLHLACEHGNLEIVKLLLDKRFKVKVNCLTKSGEAAIQLAVKSKRVALVDFLLSQKDLVMQKGCMEWIIDFVLKDNLVNILNVLFTRKRVPLEGLYVDKLRSWFQSGSATLKVKSQFFFNNIKYFLRLDVTALEEIHNSIDYNASINPKLDASDIGERLVYIFEVVSKCLPKGKGNIVKVIDCERYMVKKAIKYLIDKVMTTKDGFEGVHASLLAEKEKFGLLAKSQTNMPTQIRNSFEEEYYGIKKIDNLKISTEEKALLDKIFNHVPIDDIIALTLKLIEVGFFLNGPTGLIGDRVERDWWIVQYIAHYRWVLDRVSALGPFVFLGLINPMFVNAAGADMKEDGMDVKKNDMNINKDAMGIGKDAMDIEGREEGGSNAGNRETKKRKREEDELDRSKKRKLEEPDAENEAENEMDQSRKRPRKN